MRYKLYAPGELPFLQINAFGYSQDTKDTTFGPKKRNIFLVGYVLSGKGYYNSHPLGAGQGFIVTPEITEHITPDPRDPWELLWFTTIDLRMNDFIRYYSADEHTHIFSHGNPPELQRIKNFLTSAPRQTVSDAEMLEFFFSLLKHHMSSAERIPPHRQTAAEAYIDFSVNYINSNYNRNITIDSLTKILGVSQPYLYKIYKEAFGISPKEYITNHRITQAKKLLTESDIPISEVAASVGFCDTFAFSKCFSINVGISPTEYRNQQL